MLNRLRYFQEALDKRKEDQTLRILKPKSEGIDFYSNDYLGLARNEELQNLLLKQINDNPHLLSGSTGSRLISGNSKEVIETENFISKEHQNESALLFSSETGKNLILNHQNIICSAEFH
jgi:8-amino-7-oxononanoate synthase